MDDGKWITLKDGRRIFLKNKTLTPTSKYMNDMIRGVRSKNTDFMNKELDKGRENLPLDAISEKMDIGTMTSEKGEEYNLASQEINLSSPYVGKRFIRKITASDKGGNSAILSFYVDGNELIIKHLEGAKKGDGSGTMLLNKIIKESKKNNINKIIADDTRSLDAGGYWEKQGFKPDGQNNHYLILK